MDLNSIAAEMRYLSGSCLKGDDRFRTEVLLAHYVLGYLDQEAIVPCRRGYLEWRALALGWECPRATISVDAVGHLEDRFYRGRHDLPLPNMSPRLAGTVVEVRREATRTSALIERDHLMVIRHFLDHESGVCVEAQVRCALLLSSIAKATEIELTFPEANATAAPPVLAPSNASSLGF